LNIWWSSAFIIRAISETVDDEKKEAVLPQAAGRRVPELLEILRFFSGSMRELQTEQQCKVVSS
jgi:hypothetical protein